MKRYLRFAASLFVLTVLLGTTAYAAGGLDSFADVRAMDDSTFTDVNTGHWFYSGVKSAYEMKIMEGIGGGQFSPNATLPWSQAVTIAARVHAAYVGEEIPAAQGPWYTMYINYAEACGILPVNHPEGSAWDTTAIDRQSIAYLFRSVVGAEDCPSISNLTIPDIDLVDADKRESVAALYSAGIFTGKNGNTFDPGGQATRAEVATILARLLRPAQRVAYDSRINADMDGQQSNFFYSAGLVYDDRAVYMIYRDGNGMKPNYDRILRKDKVTGLVTTLYSTTDGDKEELSQLALAHGKLYFFHCMANGQGELRRMSLDGTAVETVCSAPKGNEIDHYLLYDGRIFTMQTRLTSSGFVDTFGEVTSGKIKSIRTYDKAEALYGFNGRIYVAADYGGELHVYDPITGKSEMVMENIEAYAFDEGKFYYLQWENRSYSDQVWVASLADLEHPLRYGKVPPAALTHYVYLAHDGDQLYYLASSGRKLYRIVPDQMAEVVAETIWASSENPILWEGCFLQGNVGMSANSNYSGEYPVTIGIGTDHRYTINVDAWLGRSAMMERISFTPEGSVFTDSLVLGGEHTAVVRKAYYNGGRLILEVEFHNPDPAKARLFKSVDVTLKAGETVLAQKVKVNESPHIASGATWKGTIIIQGSDLLAKNVDLTGLLWQLECEYNLVNW